MNNNNNNTFNNGTVSPSSVGINSFIDTFCAVNQYSSLGNEVSRGISSPTASSSQLSARSCA